MWTLFGFVLPLLILLIPVVFYLIFARKRLNTNSGIGIINVGLIAFAIGIITPFISMAVSIKSLRFFRTADDSGCYTFVAAYIFFGAVILIAIAILTLILKIIEPLKKQES